MKEEFLSTVENKSEYIELFKNSSRLESELDKDVFDFYVNEIKEIPNYNDYLSLLGEYMGWAICQAYKDNDINVVYSFLMDDEE
jgi:hypothetical protein